MSTNLKGKRVQGGTGWADAIFRSQADSKTYANTMIKEVVRRLNLEAEDYLTYFSETGFLLFKKEDLILKMSYNMEEALRCEAVYAFEECIESKIRSSI